MVGEVNQGLDKDRKKRLATTGKQFEPDVKKKLISDNDSFNSSNFDVYLSSNLEIACCLFLVAWLICLRIILSTFGLGIGKPSISLTAFIVSEKTYLATTFLVGGPQTPKDPVLGVSRHSGAARAVGLA